MAGTTDFVPFAIGSGANVETQAAYLASAQLSTGMQSGTAFSASCNKVWRQSSVMTAALAQVVANILNANVPDDGNMTNLEAQILAALQAAPHGRYLGYASFDTTGTYTPPSGATMFRLRGSGAGGGGGYTGAQSAGYAAAASGGQAGGYCEVELTLAQLMGAASSINVSIGAGGSSGVNGGSTTVGVGITLPGGVPGTPGSSNNFSTITGSTGNGALCSVPTGSSAKINAAGNVGLFGFTVSPGSNFYAVSGAGGSSPLGSGGGAVGYGTAGLVGVRGGGGSGACSHFSSSASVDPSGIAGGTGGNGYVIIEAYS